MDVVFTSLEALILKATQEYLTMPDTAALDAFCTILKDSPGGHALAAKAFTARVQGGNVKESLLALVALDHCMQRCDAKFHAEIGKFRFLNELIKLVSPKYYADRTPPEVQQRVLQLLHAWSIEYPKESKFKVAFDMLRSQGVVRQTPPPLPPEYGAAEPPPARPRAATFEDDEKSELLQKLLRSKNPDDLQYANTLIKTMVREEERRAEAAGRRALEVRQGVESARLLGSLLDAGAGGDDDRQLMRELEEACRRHHAQLAAMAAHTADAHALDEILKASDELTEVFIKYQAVMAPPTSRVNGDSLLDLAGLTLGRAPETTQLAESNLSHGARESTNRPEVNDLSDIFGCENGGGAMEPLKPVSLISPETETSSMGSQSSIAVAGAALATLDSLGAELLQKSLPGARLGEGFVGKSTKRVPMNALETSSAPPSVCDALDLDFLVQKTKEAVRREPPTPPSITADDLMLDISVGPPSESCDSGHVQHNGSGHDDAEINVESVKEHERVDTDDRELEKKVEVKSLADIEISLSSVQASAAPPLPLLDDAGGLALVLHAAADRPRPDVRVFCLSATSRHRSPVSDYRFHAVVPKWCKVRLLPPSGTCLPPHSPFAQPAAIIQLMLVARPPDAVVQLKFVATYSCDDDAVTEMGEVDLPDA